MKEELDYLLATSNHLVNIGDRLQLAVLVNIATSLESIAESLKKESK